MEWLSKFTHDFVKTALNKLPDDDLPQLPKDESEEQSVAQSVPTNTDSVTATEEVPLLWNNKHVVKTPGAEFIVELVPNILNQPAQPVSQNPMNSTVTNPNANSDLLDQWLSSSEQTTKPYSHNERGTVDPLSREDEGLDPSVKVHKKAILKNAGDATESDSGQQSAPIPIDDGADRSNPYPPCEFCANYIAETNECSQGLDVEKVQAAKSCSWLNAHISPFGKPKDPDNSGSSDKYKETVNSDTSDAGNGNGNNNMQQMINKAHLNSSLKEYLKNLWS